MPKQDSVKTVCRQSWMARLLAECLLSEGGSVKSMIQLVCGSLLVVLLPVDQPTTEKSEAITYEELK